MKRHLSFLFVILSLAAAATGAPPSAPLALQQTIPLTGVEGRIDHLAADPAGQRLFLAALGNSTLEMIDLHAGKVVHHVRDLREPQGVSYAPEVGRIFVGVGQGGTCDIFEGKSLALLQRVAGMADADNVRYDAGAKRIYVGYGNGALGMLDAATGKRLGDVRLAAHPESFQLEKQGKRIFVNVPRAHQVAVVDRERRSVVATWPVKGAAANFPMALNEADHRLYLGCRQPARLLILDTGSGKEIAGLAIGGDTDDLFYDAARQRLYVICGAGSIDVLQQKDADHYDAVAHIATAAGARTGLFVPDLGRLYLAVPHRGQQAAEVRVYVVQP
jgi:hypothetical protein